MPFCGPPARPAAMDLLRSALEATSSAYQAALPAYEAAKRSATASSLGSALHTASVAAGVLGTVAFFVLIVVAFVVIIRVFPPNAGLDSTKPSAYVRHILLQHEEQALELKQEIAHLAGKALVAEFARLARHSRCSSGAVGGALGCIGPGKMAPAFDSVVWSAPVLVLQGPVQTDAGSHLILVTQRSLPVGETKKKS